MPLASATKLGQYEIIASFGGGGTGEVYRARDPWLGRDVAIKILPTFLSPDRLCRFEPEARAAAASDNSILVTCDTGTQEVYAISVKWP